MYKKKDDRETGMVDIWGVFRFIMYGRYGIRICRDQGVITGRSDESKILQSLTEETKMFRNQDRDHRPPNPSPERQCYHRPYSGGE